MKTFTHKSSLRRLLLILAAGCLGALVVFAFGRYVEQIDDTYGAIPVSWGFKAQSREVQGFFKKGQEMTMPSGNITSALPVAMREPATTETAIFALG